MFKRVDRYGSLNDKLSLANFCGNGGELFECLGHHSKSYLELFIILKLALNCASLPIDHSGTDYFGVMFDHKIDQKYNMETKNT